MYLRSNPTSASVARQEPDNQQETVTDMIKVMGSSETTRQMTHMNQKLAMLLGILYTDGCVSPKGKSWRIYFAVKSQELVDLFRDCVVTTFAIDPNRVRVRVRTSGLTAAVVDSKSIGTYLTTRFGTFRTLKFENGDLPKAKLPVSALKKSGYVADFLRVAFSCDGGVSFYPASRNSKNGKTKWLIRTVFISCAHPQMRSDYLALLKSLGIYVRNVAKDGKLKIERERDIRLFSKKIGFVDGVKAMLDSKFWNGYEKNEVLRTLINSYGQPATIYQLPKFSESMI